MFEDFLAIDAGGVSAAFHPRLRAFAAAGTVRVDDFAAMAFAGGERALAAGGLHAAVVLAVRLELLAEAVDLSEQQRLLQRQRLRRKRGHGLLIRRNRARRFLGARRIRIDSAVLRVIGGTTGEKQKAKSRKQKEDSAIVAGVWFHF